MTQRRSSRSTLVVLGCTALLGMSRSANADPDVYKPIREMWSVPYNAWKNVTAAHVNRLTQTKAGTPTASLFNPMAHAAAWAATAKNSRTAARTSCAAWNKGMGTLHNWRGSYHHGRALGTGMVGQVGLSAAHTITARQHESMAKLYQNLAKLLGPSAPPK